jgi:predicted enzyme related to lactoylglutathione lyase
MKKIMIAIAMAAALGACAGVTVKPTTGDTMLEIKLATVYVNDQGKALRFYTEVLGFTVKDDVSKGPFRWLTVKAAGAAELQLAADDDPAAKAYREAMFRQSHPAAMFFTDDVRRDYERLKARGAAFTMPPTDVTGSTIAMLDDTCGNLIQITQLRR